VILTLPIPFTLAALAVGMPVSPTHVVALNLLLAFTHAVRLLHYGARLPIIPAIAVSAAGYCAAGALLRPLMPRSELSFWIACVATILVAVGAQALFPHRDEPDHRSPMPAWLKFPLVAAVILAHLVIKRFLQGLSSGGRRERTRPGQDLKRQDTRRRWERFSWPFWVSMSKSFRLCQAGLWRSFRARQKVSLQRESPQFSYLDSIQAGPYHLRRAGNMEPGMAFAPKAISRVLHSYPWVTEGDPCRVRNAERR
jgi:hypothetical protein